MERRWLQVLTVATIAAAAAACSDRPASITAPVSQPRAAYVNGYVTLTDAAGNEWLALTGTGKAVETKSAVIDTRGGTVQLEGTSLSVPKDAVDGPTLFTVTILTEPYIKVQLTAVTVSGSGRGKKGSTAGEEVHDFWDHPLTLTMSVLRGAKKNLPDPSLFKMVYVVDGTVMEVAETSVDYTRKGIVAKILHFSDYTPATPAGDSSPFAF